MSNASIAVRFSRAELHLISPGLSLIVARHKLRQRGHSSYADPELRISCRKWGQYQPYFGTMIINLDQRLRACSTRRSRVRLNAFELAACMLAVRVAQTRVRHGHVEPWRKRQRSAAKKLLYKLETYRKRSKRALIHEIGARDFGEASRAWRRMVVFTRSHFLYCECRNQRVWAPGMRRFFQTIISDCTTMAADGLRQLGAAVPAPAVLRRLTRAALKNVRRSPDLGVKILLNHREFGRTFLAEYVLRRHPELKPKKNGGES
jgi:hypothetical protein